MNTDRWIGLGVLVLCALFWFVIIPEQTEGATEAFMPRLAVIGLAIPSLIMLMRHRSTVKPPDFDPGAFLHSTLPCIGAFAMYVLGVACIGFYLPTACFLVFALLLFGERKLKTLVLTPALLVGVVYVVMSVCLNFELPSGLLF